ncbi:MDR family NADP-dependent oxidoreductase [Aspergillus ibericus CBS 121593]|uniref:Oxidoreductase n=1 Tax=Aspergillus ibericus CBS 121593 TaxID=1448316 RepID=A0A395H3Y8_9EURO|nr:oxidoreductase [Aspergillus ibericus CBS 121593]RAL00944.1 oxidoreductase [Aspergillus ibericus CBS 121593]
MTTDLHPNLSLTLTNIPTGLPIPNKDLTTLPSPISLTQPLSPNTLLAKTLYASLDPYMRGRMRPAHIPSYSPAYPLHAPITAYGLVQVLRSNHPLYSRGQILYCRVPVSEYSILDSELKWESIKVIPYTNTTTNTNDSNEIPLPHYLGILGMPGLTAYAGLYEIGRPQRGETIFISSAAGAVGSIVGQIAKREGLRVIGSCGGSEKVKYVLEELGFDACFDYRVEGVREALGRVAPEGVDVYFENVGGEVLEGVLEGMNVGGRVVVCGMISQYNLAPEDRYGIKNLGLVVTKRIHMQGFIVGDAGFGPKYEKERDEKVSAWLREGSIVAKEHITTGIENGPEALVGMLRGENLGKAILKIADPEPL